MSPRGPKRDVPALAFPHLHPLSLMFPGQESDLWFSLVLPSLPPTGRMRGPSISSQRLLGGGGGTGEGRGEVESDHRRAGETLLFLPASSHCSRHDKRMLKRSGLDRQQSTGNYSAISPGSPPFSVCVCRMSFFFLFLPLSLTGNKEAVFKGKRSLDGENWELHVRTCARIASHLSACPFVETGE